MLQTSYLLFAAVKIKGDKFKKQLVHSLHKVKALYVQDLLCVCTNFVHNFGLTFIPSIWAEYPLLTAVCPNPTFS